MPDIRRVILVVMVLCVAARGQSNTNEPHIGYLYPAGGQQGTTVQITVGGQALRDAADVYISGEGVHASIIKYYRPLRNIQKEQRQLLQKRLKELRERHLSEPNGWQPPPKGVPGGKPKLGDGLSSDNKGDAKMQEVTLPEHPLLYDLENKSIRELANITNMIFFPRRMQQVNRQIAEMVLVEITVDPDAAPGNRELRLLTRTGLTNPVVFQVGLPPEVRELEPNNQKTYTDLPNVPKEKPLDLPVSLNGQIMPGDIDRFRFSASKGQRLVIQVQARSLIPYLADAVPGWFQAVVALYDAKGDEVAYADDYEFNPDPVLFYRIPEGGEYELEIRDSIYRGREDFVYRISVSEQPFITQMFPLGGRSGVETTASISGWNLPSTELTLDTKDEADCICRTEFHRGKQLSNSVMYAVNTLPECDESESDDTVKDARRIELPVIINGRIDAGGDIDFFRFAGRAGERIAAEVNARRLNSPLDSLLRLTDADGTVLAWNDDYVIEDNYLYENISGLLTHHADSYLMFELPGDGTYYIQISDTQNHGGREYGYRLRIAEARGDFALRAAPSGLNARAGGNVPVCVYALRKDGFDGEIEVVLKDAPPGFELDGARIPAGCNRVRMTLKTPLKAPEKPVTLFLEGRAVIDGRIIKRPVVPADDMMQAFLYRHLVPAGELLVHVQSARGIPDIERDGDGPVKIPAGGSVRVLFRGGRRANFSNLQLQLSEPPDGLTLEDVTATPGSLELLLKADKKTIKDGFRDNLIIEAMREFVPRQQEGRPNPQKRRVSMGFLPAVPIEIVQ